MLRRAFGDKLTETHDVNSGSEDFSAFVAAGVPSFYFGIGGLDATVVAKAKAAGTYPPGNHNPAYAPLPEPSIKTGVLAMTFGRPERACTDIGASRSAISRASRNRQV